MYDLQTHFFYVGLIPYSLKFVKPFRCWFEIGCFNNNAKLGGKNLLIYLTLQLLLLYNLLITVPTSGEKKYGNFLPIYIIVLYISCGKPAQTATYQEWTFYPCVKTRCNVYLTQGMLTQERTWLLIAKGTYSDRSNCKIGLRTKANWNI